MLLLNSSIFSPCNYREHRSPLPINSSADKRVVNRGNNRAENSRPERRLDTRMCAFGKTFLKTTIFLRSSSARIDRDIFVSRARANDVTPSMKIHAEPIMRSEEEEAVVERCRSR